jgi:predicted exporter
MSVDDLLEDRVALDGVLMKCDQNPAKARTDTDCLNARIAVEKLAAQKEPAEEAQRNAEFERTREQLRSSQDRQRLEQDAKTKVDAYSLPVVPVDPAPAPPTTSAPAEAQPAVIGQARP